MAILREDYSMNVVYDGFAPGFFVVERQGRIRTLEFNLAPRLKILKHAIKLRDIEGTIKI